MSGFGQQYLTPGTHGGGGGGQGARGRPQGSFYDDFDASESLQYMRHQGAARSAPKRRVPLRRFAMAQIAFPNGNESKGPVIAMIGRRGTGKSVLLVDLLSHFQDVPVVTIISGTEEGNGTFARFVPSVLIHNEFKPTIVEGVLRRQLKVLKRRNRAVKTFGSSSIDARCIFVMDDCLYDPKFVHDPSIRCIFVNGRHWRVMFIITLQYVLGLPPLLRNQIDFSFILREPSMRTRRILYDNFASCFPTLDAFCQTLDQTTQNFECMVVHNSAISNDLSDMVFFYKARANIPPFRLAAQAYWDISERLDEERRLREEAEDDDDDGDIPQIQQDDFTKRSAGPRLVVQRVGARAESTR